MVWKPHVTVAAVVEDQGRYLMVEENIRGELRLNQPAGHLEENEHPIDAVIREMKEETGWDGEVLHMLPIHLWKHPEGKKTFLRFSFVVKAIRHHIDAPLDEGIIAPTWLSLDELKQRSEEWRSPMIGRSIEDYQNQRYMPLDSVESLNL